MLNEIAAIQGPKGFDVMKMFSEVFRSRSAAQIEESLAVGTARTTPSILEISTDWPRPWLFARCFLLFGLAYLGFVIAWANFDAIDLAPGLIVAGAFAGPMSTLMLFFELNVRRNVSLYRLIVLTVLGGISGLLISFAAYKAATPTLASDAAAGLIEELGKFAALILLTSGWPHKYLLNGMLFGAAIGAGFAAWESAGYAFQISLHAGGRDAIMANLLQRGLGSPFMHVTWSAMLGAALWRVRGAGPVRFGSFFEQRFYGVLMLVIALHTAWNVIGDALGIFKPILLGLIAWYVTLGLVQQGLQEIRDEQQCTRALSGAHLSGVSFVTS